MLNNHSYYSLRYGTLEPSAVLELAEQLGYKTLPLTDINCTAGIIEFARLALKKGMKPVAGIDFRNGVKQCFVALARNNGGFAAINEYLSAHLHAGETIPMRAPSWENTFVIYPLVHFLDGSIAVDELREHEFIGISLHDVGKLRFTKVKLPSEKLVYMHPATFCTKRDFNAHRLLRAIDNNTLLSKLPVEEQADAEDRLYAESHVREVLDEFQYAFGRSRQLLDDCAIDFGFKGETHKNLLHYGESAEEDEALLLSLCKEGLSYRYPDAGPQVMQRLEKELHLIREKKFVSYFLINWDIVNYARSRNYYYVGRGSGANSIVAYLLRITDVDPLELDLYFERFINLFRQSPPDFDIDFSWKEREDITRYIFEKFRNATLLGAFNTFQYSAVVRELGKVFGLPKSDIDLLSDGKFNYDELDTMHQQVLRYASYLKDFPNYISIHSAGILITEQPIYYYGATFLPPKGFPTAMFDMHQAEDIGINKLDILSQRGLGKIKDTLAIIQYNQPDRADIDIHDIKRFKNDEQCNDLLRRGEALGCFYVESPAMRMLLTKLQTHNYIGLVAASSVIRPGVSSSGMMRAYIIRERIPERRSDAPEPLMRLMPETHGVMVYQEDVIKVAHEFAGLTLAEADVLRRGMSGKFRGRDEFEHARNNFLKGALERGHSDTLVRDVWRQVESFAGYAFAKGHSASYAVESYQCLFLKAYFPLEYMTATINNFGGFFKTEIYVHEARMHGAHIEAPCVNRSSDEASITGVTINLGLQMIKGLEHGVRESIARARMNGEFITLDDFLDRVVIGLEQAVLLARMGALRFTEMGKKELLWQLHFKLGHGVAENSEQLLFTTRRADAKLPQLEHHWLEDAYDELELLGFPLCNPFQLIDYTQLPEHRYSSANEMKESIHQEIHIIGYKVALKPTGTSKGEGMFFGTFLDEQGHFIDTVHFPPVAKAFPASGWGLFHIHGKVTEEFGAFTIEVKSIKRLDLLPDPRVADGPSHPALMRKSSGNDRWVNRTLHGKPKLK
ncbi:MAG: PHP domain-containing protein [Flavobacteriales bacterium]